MSKEQWIIAHDQLENELDREPTPEEAESRLTDNIAKMMDAEPPSIEAEAARDTARMAYDYGWSDRPA